MKIKVIEKSYDDVMNLPLPEPKKPKTPTKLVRSLVKTFSMGEVKKCNVKFNKKNLDELGNTPALILMNHSCFLDLKIASVLFKDRPFNIVTTADGFVGKENIMRMLGCIPTQKFVTDTAIVRDIKYALQTNKCSVLMYPEASYSFDGTATTLPNSLGKLIKLLDVPVVTVITHGAFLHDPLYNGLQLRNVDVSVDAEYFLTPDDIKSLSLDEINEKLKKLFSFDNFSWQLENKVKITENFRADGLNRVLYKCPNCNAEGKMHGKGTVLKCTDCNKEYTLSEYGQMESEEIEISHIPDWYKWERECVKKEIESGTYRLDCEVDIYISLDFNAIYKVGSGRLVHDENGFKLTGCDGKLEYTQSPLASYSLYSDYFWYEIGDVICIGDKKYRYYCFPKNTGDIVAKTRLAAEELYKIKKRR